MQSVVSDTHSLATGVLDLQQGATPPMCRKPMPWRTTRSFAAMARWCSFEPNKIAVAMMKAFLGRARHPGRGIGQRA